MGERERAEHYEATRNDAEEWGEPVPAVPRRKLATIISVRFAAEEISKIRSAARRKGLTVSAFLRAGSPHGRRGNTDGPSDT
ncbi:plasmid mobilization protein [Streptomyces sp. L7]